MGRALLAYIVLSILATATQAAADDEDPNAIQTLSGGDLRVEPGADHLVLGDEGQLSVIVTTSAETREVSLTTNVGRVGSAEREGPGRFEALYTPPEQFYPQVAIIVATAIVRGEPKLGWTVLRLWGKGNARVTTRPNAKVSVRIGKTSHGPVRADRSGVALVPVVVPPGVKHGWDGRRQVDLNLPPMNHLHMVAPSPRLPGVEAKEVPLYLFTVDDGGGPRADSPPVVDAFGGRVEPVAVSPGVWRATVTVPAGKPAKLELTASIAGEPASRLQLERTAGPPERLTIEVPKLAGPAVSPLKVSVRVTDALGTPVEARVQGSCDEGSFEAFVRRGPGRFEALWRPPGKPERTHAQLEVRAGAARGQVRIELPSRRRRLSPVWFWTGVASAGALITTGVVTQVVLRNKSSEYKDPATPVERRRELKESGEPLIATSGVTLGLGVAAAVASGVLYFFTDFGGERPVVSAGPVTGGGQVVLGGRF
jgi:hypothetical protein